MSGRRKNPGDWGDEIIDGMARALWVTSWANHCEDLSPARHRRLRDNGLIPGPGEDWDDYAPATPPTAVLGAKRLAREFERLNHASLSELYDRAVAADGSRRPRRGGPEIFGHDLAMEAMGHGVSWFDDHANFPLKFPRASAYYDGRRLTVEA